VQSARVILVTWFVVCAHAQDAPAEFFEKRIRPLLAARCYACHSAKTVASAGLALDTRDSTRKGGNRGQAVTPGSLDASVLWRAVSYDDPALRMPPQGRLAAVELDDLRRWIESGAYDPRDASPRIPAQRHIDWKQAREWWAFRPLQSPPSAATIDAFLNDALKRNQLKPASPADDATWLRRVTYDLTGLPPTPGDLAAFLADRSPRARESVADRLLASPHYGERWARHWLDLVRFAETKGHEFDPDIPEAWRYRDYVIRAFNADLPYDRFVREHLAGDLLDQDRRLAATGAQWESPLATGFFGLGEERNAADDIAGVRAERIDNQIDVLGKAFFGLTIACARCHDHKFDPIPTQDYYSIAGVFHSTQVNQVAIDAPSQIAEQEAIHRRIEEANRHVSLEIRPALRAVMDEWQPSPVALRRALEEPENILHPLAVLAEEDARPFVDRVAALRRSLLAPIEDRGDIEFDRTGWFVSGPAFHDAAITPNQPLGAYGGGPLFNSFRGGSDRLTGTVVSKGFRLTRPYIHVRLSGTRDPAQRREPNLVAFTLVADGRLDVFVPEGDGVFVWRTSRPRRQFNQWVHFEIRDKSDTGHIAVERIVLSDHKQPPPVAPPDPRVIALLEGVSTYGELVGRYRDLFLRHGGEPRLLAAFAGERPLEDYSGRTPWMAVRERAEAGLSRNTFALVAGDDTGHNVRVHVRGNPANLAEEAPRRFLRVLAGDEPFRDPGSGRKQLARTMTSGPSAALLARVMVNRVWKHHFSEGIVSSPDNFGRTGDAPSHPELLETLAARFIEQGWSVKSLHRQIVLSEAYGRSSRASGAARKQDPDNRLLSHMPVRRLEAESIRDAMLAVSGRLDPKIGGPSVTPHISSYQDGRGKPRASGPLDGEGRRSLYIEVRRNFLTPLLLAFDYPLPVQTIGRRSVSTVASQALMLMNNDFVAGQAGHWAKRLVAAEPAPQARVDRMFLEAFARRPAPAERADILRFVNRQRSRYPESVPPEGIDESRLWADVAHVLFNSKEFIFLR
jgi:hypothetical protein